MYKVNWTIVNIAFWVELLLSYFLPFKVVDNFEYKVGYPMHYITVYKGNGSMGISPLTSMALNPLGLLFNVILLYLVIVYIVKIYNLLKQRKNR